MNYQRYKKLSSSVLLSAGMFACTSDAFAADTSSSQNSLIEDVNVTSQFRDVSSLKLASSISVFSQQDIAARGASNIDQLINLAPNVNFSTGASRGRFYQIRGIGERSQFVDPVTPSVGLIIDGIDFTGLGLAGNTFDVQQVEILRGPQGTLYGANALAGLISVTSNSPTDDFTAIISAEAAEYDSTTLSAVVSGPISDSVGYRLAMQNQQSDGYIENDFLNRDDTNNIDESIVRGKLNVDISDDLQLNFTGVYLDVDNGYDAFSLYNTRTTLSDMPGWDRQETVAAALETIWAGSDALTLEAVLSFANSDTEYGYDEDWTFDGFHPFGYSSTDNYLREKDNISLDLRAVFNGDISWVVGVYARSEEESLERRVTFESDFETENYAIYGQLQTELTSQLTLTTGLRLEQRSADYRDNVIGQFDNDDDLWGGNITLEYQLNDDVMLYGLLSRGYKGGGVNARIISASVSNTDITEDQFEFDSESMLNYELGLKGHWLDGRLQSQLALFYQKRKDVQAKQSIFNPSDFSFDDFLTNAAGGDTSGLELAIDYLVAERLRVFATLGLLEAEFDGFLSQAHVDARDDNLGAALAPVDLDGRDAAHAPNYQFSLGAEVELSDRWQLRVDVEGKDEFYYSNSHNEKSKVYNLFNARLAYQADNWQVALWGRNLTDKEVRTRGFYFSNAFGNNPANGYAPETYYQLAEPRVLGVSGSYTF